MERTVPSNPDLEQQVLSALISQPDALFSVDTILNAACFYTPQNRILFEAISTLVNQQRAADLVALSQYLTERNLLDQCGGFQYLTEVARADYSTAYLKEKSLQLRSLLMQRDLITLTLNAAERSYGQENPYDVIELVEKRITEIQTSAERTEARPLNLCIQDFFRSLTRTEGYRPPITTGLNGLDAALNGGFHAPDLVILGGRPSMGKTQFALHFAEIAARAKSHVLFVSLEMTTEQLVTRMLARKTSIAAIRNHTLLPDDFNILQQFADERRDLPISIIDSTEATSLAAIKSAARREKRRNGIDLLIIDYLQMVRVTGQRFEKRYMEVGHITRELKLLAKELNICVILLAQLSRAGKGFEKREPTMDDLRESGDIEQDADIILFPYRPSVIDPNACDETGRSWNQRGKVIIAKNREGQRNVECRFSHDRGFKTIVNEIADIPRQGGDPI